MNFHKPYHIMHFDSALTALPRFLAGTVSGVSGSGFIAIMLGAQWVRRKGKAFAEHRDPRGLDSGLGERAPEVVAAFSIYRSTNERQISLIVVLHTQPN